MNSGIEHAALMISEEKTQHDSRKDFLFLDVILLFSGLFWETKLKEIETEKKENKKRKKTFEFFFLFYHFKWFHNTYSNHAV